MSENFLKPDSTISVVMLLHIIARKLYPIYGHSGAVYNNSWLILEYVTGKKKEQLIIEKTIDVCQSIYTKITTILRQIITDHKPLQYITERVYFLGLELSVKPPVLIPRPETEDWLYRAIDEISPYVKKASRENPFMILDLCTGSGCIALALAHHFGPHVHVTAIDNAAHALELAQANACRLSGTTNCTIMYSDLYNSLSAFKTQFDLIVTNPPYIRPHEFSTLEPEVIRWEDRNALVAGDNGLGLIKRIVEGAPQFLRTQYDCAQLWCEIGMSQGSEVMQLFKSQGFCATHIVQDVNKKDRVVCGRLGSSTCGILNRGDYA